MTQSLKPIALAIVCLALGAAIQRAYDARHTLGPLATRSQESRSPTTARAVPSPARPWTAAEVDRSKVDYSKQPLWAWGVDDPPKSDEKQAVQGAPGPAPANQNQSVPVEELNRKRHVDGSRFEYSLTQIRAGTNGNFVDWFPEDHPNPVPDIITRGPAALGKDSRACGSCHLSDGSGRPENASPAALPAGYIIRQLNDFRNDLRHNADPRKGNSNTMVMLAKAMSDDEIRQAAEYFSAVAWRPHVQVVETTRVPKTRIQGELFIPIANERTEPIGNRIIEVPTDVEGNQTLRNSRGTWIAYVPLGTIKKGKDLVATGGMKVVNGQIVQGKSTACGTCHGPDLLGVPPDVPPLVGRSPSYLAREIFDIQQGVRRGSNSNVPLMKMVVERLTPEDILAITAYLASLPARRGTPPPEDFIARRGDLASGTQWIPISCSGSSAIRPVLRRARRTWSASSNWRRVFPFFLWSSIPDDRLTVTSKLLTYAIGRGTEFTMPPQFENCAPGESRGLSVENIDSEDCRQYGISDAEVS